MRGVLYKQRQRFHCIIKQDKIKSGFLPRNPGIVDRMGIFVHKKEICSKVKGVVPRYWRLAKKSISCFNFLYEYEKKRKLWSDVSSDLEKCCKMQNYKWQNVRFSSSLYHKIKYITIVYHKGVGKNASFFFFFFLRGGQRKSIPLGWIVICIVFVKYWLSPLKKCRSFTTAFFYLTPLFYAFLPRWYTSVMSQ